MLFLVGMQAARLPGSCGFDQHVVRRMTPDPTDQAALQAA